MSKRSRPADDGTSKRRDATYSLVTCLVILISAGIFIAPILAQTAAAAQVIATFEAKTRIGSSTITGMPVNSQMSVSYIRGGWYVMDILAGTSSTHADLDKNVSIVDNTNIIIMTSTVTSSTISGVAVGDSIKCTFDNTVATQTCENLTKGTRSSGMMWFFNPSRQTIPDPDTTAPTVSITAPANGATISGTISVTASASDNVGVTKVAFYVDGVLKSTDTTSAYSYSLDTTTLSNAVHTIKAIAYDAANNQGTHQISVTVSNTVADTTAPVVTVPSPMTLEATSSSGRVVTFTATATDNKDGTLTPVCSPVSGSTFPLGTTTVACSASDSSGNTGTASFTITVRDTTAPALSLPASMTLEATSSSGRAVTFTATATDIVDGSRPVTCTPASGSTFPLGTTTVACSATDTRGNTASGSFTITIRDTTAPVVSIISPANGASVQGAISITASATDAVGVAKVEFYVDGILKSTDTASPFTYSLDTTTLSNAAHTIKAIANDAANNQANHQISVTVSNTVADASAPIVTPPTNQIKEATSASGAVVSYPSATATDNVDGSLTAVCTPASGSTFPLGTTTVTCTATDSSGNTGSATFTVTVRDTTAPSLSLPANKIVEATSASGATVTFTASATDLVNGARSVSCTPTSGSIFAIGTRTVSCSATDLSGNTATGSFTVTVRDTTAPAASMSSPSNGAVVAGTITVSASASDVVGVSKMELHVDGLLKATDFTSPYSFSLDTKGVADGTHIVKVVASDSSNNQASAQVSVTVDNTSPSMSITGPSNGATVSGTITITASAADALSGIHGVNFYFDGAFIVMDSVSPYESTALDTTLYTDGSHTMKAMALDTAFNIASQEITVNVDNSVAIPPPPPPDTTAPTVSFIDPVSGETISGTATVQVSATDNVGMNVVYFYVDGVNKGSDFAAPYTFSVDTTVIADGNHIMKAKAFDKSNNQNYTEISVTVSNAPPAPPDVNPPVLSLPSSITAEATSPSGAAVTYTATATDDVDGAVPVTCAIASGSTFAIETTIVDCYAEDSSGNMAVDSFIVTVQDTTNPTVSITSPTNNQGVSGVIGITVQASDKVGVAYVDLYLDGAYLGTDLDSPYENYEVDTTLYTDGAHKLQAQAVDEYGNTASSAIITINVDNSVQSGNVPPTVTIVSPTTGSTVKGSVTVSISADDSDGAIDYIELYLDGTLLATLPGGASTTYTFTWDTATASNGSHVLKAIAYDDSGNSSEDSETVKVLNKGAGGGSGGKGGGPKK